MKRKLSSIVFGIFAIFLLMGASSQKNTSAATIIDENVISLSGTADAKSTNSPEVEVPLLAGAALDESEVLIPDNYSLLVDEAPISAETQNVMVNGVTYVSLKGMAEEIEPEAAVTWNQSTLTVSVKTEQLALSATHGDQYLVANGRYLYITDKVQTIDGVLMVPLAVLAEAFDATIHWDGATNVTHITEGSGGIVHADAFYNADELFWMSRVIHAESSGESLKGKIAVGNVILNRVNSPVFPNSILGVIAQKNQFSTYRGGRLEHVNPNHSSVIAAKIVLDGGVVEGLHKATYFDSTGGNSWAARNKTCVAVIGGHKFYG